MNIYPGTPIVKGFILQPPSRRTTAAKRGEQASRSAAIDPVSTVGNDVECQLGWRAIQQRSEAPNVRDDLPKNARLMTVEQVLANEILAFEGVVAVDVYPSIPVPNDEKWDSFSAVIEIVRPTGERLRRRARFEMMHWHYAVGAKPPEKPLPFWEMDVILYDVGVDDVPVGSVIFADETVEARLNTNTH